jgi:hypothetical protein
MSLTWKAPMIIKGPSQWKPQVVIPPNPDFVSTWDTTKAGSASNTVVLPLLSGGTTQELLIGEMVLHRL